MGLAPRRISGGLAILLQYLCDRRDQTLVAARLKRAAFKQSPILQWPNFSIRFTKSQIPKSHNRSMAISHLPIYSQRSATMGSTFAARAAGQ